MTEEAAIAWRVWTDEGGLAWADPGPDHGALGAAVRDCASTLSPRGSTPALSTYWVDLLLDMINGDGEVTVGHGNLWVLTRVGDSVEVRMDVDPPTSEPVDVVGVMDLVRGLETLRSEVKGQLVRGHELDDRYWAQRNPST